MGGLASSQDSWLASEVRAALRGTLPLTCGVCTNSGWSVSELGWGRKRAHSTEKLLLEIYGKQIKLPEHDFVHHRCNGKTDLLKASPGPQNDNSASSNLAYMEPVRLASW